MKYFPVEIIRLIFSLLLQRDQLQCMAVCRKWNDIIQHYSLIRMIYIEHQQQLELLMEYVKRNPTFGAKVERLTLRLDPDAESNQEALLQGFPNVREFSTAYFNPYEENLPTFKRVQKHPWCKTIECMNENNCDMHVMPLLNSGVCPNLTQLRVGGYREGTFRDLVEALASAPALKTFHLRGYDVSFEELELLHQTVPYLSALSLDNLSFHDTTLPLIIEPVASLTCLEIRYIQFDTFNEHNQLYRYVSQKYTQTKELEFTVPRNHITNDEWTQDDIEFKAIIGTYLKRLGHRLDILQLSYLGADDDFIGRFGFDLLDEGCCKIKKLDLCDDISFLLLENLSNTSQVKYIQSLRINNLISDNKGFISLEWLRHFTNLKELTLVFPGYAVAKKLYPLNLTHLLDRFIKTKLVTLELGNIELDFDHASLHWVYTSLKEFSLFETIFKGDIGMSISIAFPNLRRLKLKGCSFLGTSLNFSNLDLAYLELKIQTKEKNYPVLLTTLNTNQQRLYTARHVRYLDYCDFPSFVKNDWYYSYTVSKPFDPLTDTPLLTIVCKSVWNIDIEIGER